MVSLARLAYTLPARQHFHPPPRSAFTVWFWFETNRVVTVPVPGPNGKCLNKESILNQYLLFLVVRVCSFLLAMLCGCSCCYIWPAGSLVSLGVEVFDILKMIKKKQTSNMPLWSMAHDDLLNILRFFIIINIIIINVINLFYRPAIVLGCVCVLYLSGAWHLGSC